MTRHFPDRKGGRAGGWLALALLTACGTPDPGEVTPQLVGTPLEGCCLSAEAYPRPLIALADPAAPLIGRTVGAIVMRPGYLESPEAQAAVQAPLRPLDLLVVSSKGRLSGHALPGTFSHVVIYLGTEAELRALGVWMHPAVVPYHAAIRAGETFIESDSPGVHLSTAETVLETDAAVVLRPQLGGRSHKRQAAVNLFHHIGQRFDFWFDNDTSDQIYCAELALVSMPGLDLPTRMLYGRRSVVPNDVVAQAAVGKGKLKLVRYVRGTRTGWRVASAAQLVADLRAKGGGGPGV